MPPPRPPKRRGVALGALGVLLLAFFSVVFMMGRHHTSLHDIYEGVVHPFDPHPVGIDPRSRTGQIVRIDSSKGSGSSGQPGSGDAAAKEGGQQQQAQQQKAAASPSPSPSAQPSPSPSPPPALPPPAKKEDGPVMSELAKKHAPTRELAQSLAQDGYLLVTWANWHYRDFVKTWVAHVQGVGVTGYVVGAMDDKLLQYLLDHKLNTFSMDSGLTLGDFGWGSKTFAKMGREKINLVALFLRLGVDVVIADVDVLWLRNPIPYFKQYAEADILVSSDHLENSVKDESLEIWPQAASAANIGIMLFRNKSIDFVDKWIEIIEADEKVWDQNAFNDLFRKGIKVLPDDPKHYFMGYHESLKMGILPVALFASGHTFFTQRMFERLGLQPYALHATFQFSGTNGKRNRMREFMLFEDPPEYYDFPGGFVTFSFDHMDSLVANAGPRTGQMDLANVVGHFELMKHQMQRTRNALAISGMLGRALIMPKLTCGLDRWWAPHSGTIPGSKFPLPFHCPMDHVFDLETGWAREMPESEFGPNTPFREYSFLNNTRCPDHIKTSRITVEVCPAGTVGCSDGSKPAEVEKDKVRVQEGLLSEQLKVALANTQKYKVLEFTTMANAIKNFTNPADWSKFASRMKTYSSIWCCIMAHPGHIWYDMLWDVPHMDRHNRQWNGTWELKTGP